MARNTQKNLKSAIRYMFSNRYGFTNEIGLETGIPTNSNVDHDFDNAKALTWSDAADLNSHRTLSFDGDNVVRVDEQGTMGSRQQATFNINANGGLATQTFFIAPRTLVITNIEELHSTAGSDSGAVSATITHETGTQAPGTGTAVMTNTFNLKATANTVQAGTLLSPSGDGSPAPALVLAKGDRLSIVFTGTLTSLAGVVVTVASAPGYKEVDAVYAMNANGSIATQSFFLANRDCQVQGVQMIWSAAGTAAGTVTLDVQHDTGTTAPGSGTTILSAAVSAKTAANTVVSPALATGPIILNAGDRLSVVTTGTLTSLAGVVIVVTLSSTANAGYYGQLDATFTLKANGSQATQGFFIADRDYLVVDDSVVWATAGSGTVDFRIVKGVTAPGSGTSILTGTIAATGTANTPGHGTLGTRSVLLLSKGDLLAIVLGGTLGALAGVTANVSLLAV